jgi:hypothetical protein
MSDPRCLVCQRPCNSPRSDEDPVVWDCPGCGFFSVPAALQGPVGAVLLADPRLPPRLSRTLRLAADSAGDKHVEPLLPPEADASALGSILRDLASLQPFPQTVGQKLDEALRWLAGSNPQFGQRCEFSNLDVSAFCARIGDSANLANPYIDELGRLGYLRLEASPRGVVLQGRITAEGWARVEALQNGLPDSTLVFLALSNHYGLDGDPDGQGPQLRDAIAAALPAPLSAYRVENDHSAVDITDEIVANIRRARFVVADLTCARPNVYFEAGLAMGLGKPVVFTRRAGETAHFDVAAYKIIEWAPGQPGPFTVALKNHLVARALIPAV